MGDDAQLRNSGIEVLGQIPWGAHVCLFYETKTDLLDTLVPYFRSGLESNELCLWAITDPLTADEARAGLARGIPDFDRYVAAGSIDILPGREWYLDRERFDLNRITGGWNEKLKSALERGYKGLRISGNAFWHGTDYWREFAEYEEELDRIVGGQAMIVLCTYALHVSRGADVLDVAGAHGVAVARRRGAWEYIESARIAPSAQPLTPREIEVLGWVARGKSAWEVGTILNIAKRTVDEHVQNAIGKLGASNRTEAVAIAIRDRIIGRTEQP